MTIKELVDKINGLGLIQKHYPEEVSYGEEIDSILEKCQFIQGGIDVDLHRHYETEVYVYRFGSKYLGIRLVSKLYSEISEIEDMYHTITANEMQKVLTTTFVRKDLT